MKKRIALTVACLFLLSSAAFAAPLTDYTQGKASIDLNYRGTKVSDSEISLDRNSNFEPSITYGVSEKWAVQYRNASSISKRTPVIRISDGVPGDLTGTLTVNEFNVLYSLTPEVSAFAGYVTTKATSEFNGVKSSESKNTWQLGLLANIPLAEKVSAYGVLGAGGKWVNYEIGLSYAFTPNWELNLDYRDMKGNFSGGDVKAKGWGIGATYKFN